MRGVSRKSVRFNSAARAGQSRASSSRHGAIADLAGDALMGHSLPVSKHKSQRSDGTIVSLVSLIIAFASRSLFGDRFDMVAPFGVRLAFEQLRDPARQLCAVR